MDTLLNTVLSSALFLSTTVASPAPATTDVVFTRVLQEKDYVGYVVEKDSTLAEIALKAYGSEEYWTVVWNDNPVISDPEEVSAEQVLKIRVQKPAEPAELADVLSARNAALTQQKNDAYLQQIGYQSVIQAQPTLAPTQAAQAPVTNSTSPISEDAITYLGNCEAGNNPARNSGNGYYGAFQFSYGTWKSLNTGYERADMAPLEVQRAAVKQLLSRSSIYNQFPGCAKKMRGAGLI
jgi:hypothetical protein